MEVNKKYKSLFHEKKYVSSAHKKKEYERSKKNKADYKIPFDYFCK